MNAKTRAVALLAAMALAACAGDGGAVMPYAPAPAAPVVTPGFATPGFAPTFVSAGGQPWQVRRVTCAQLLAAPERDREAAAMFYYGYLAGRRRAEAIEAGRADADLRRAMQQCARNPGLAVAAAFEQTLYTPPRWIWQAP